MIHLVPITETEYQAYLESDIQRYAEEQVKAGNWHPSEALERSRREHQQLLADGLATPNQYVFSLQDKETGLKVGTIWFAVDDKKLRPSAFVYDFVIYDEFRRKGYGTQALRALENKLGELGVNKISLHVFRHNHAAKALYDKVGFEVVGFYMSKELS